MESGPKIPNELRQMAIDASFNELMSRAVKYDPKFAELLSSKFDEDRVSFLAAFQEEYKGKKTVDWASSNCRKCYGRGYVGHVVGTGMEVNCACTAKNYHKTLAKFRVLFNERRKHRG